MKRIHIIALIASLLLCAGASAQSFRSGYFLENYVHGYRINPAQINQKSFASLLLGNIELQNNSTFGMSTLLFPRNGKVVTGFNSAVTAQDFMAALPTRVGMSMDETINILSFGIREKKPVMHTFEVNVRVLTGMGLPKELFAFLKQGGEQTYDISGINVNVAAIGDIVYGHARRITDQITVGARVHFLVGAISARAYSANSNITMGAQETTLNSDIYLQTSGLLKLSTTADGNLDTQNIKFNGNPIGGFGGGLDLGVEYEPLEDLKVMFSITDLGFIAWKNTTNLQASGTVKYTGTDIKYENGSVQTDFEAVLEKLKESIHFHEGANPTYTEFMPFNIALGARYKMPFYKPLSAGLFSTVHIAGLSTWYDLRLGVTFTPAYILSLSTNIGYGTFGPTFGGALNLHLGPVNLIAGADSFLGNMGKINGAPVPLKGFVMNAHLGLGFTF